MQLTRTDAAGYSVQRLVYQDGAVCAVYDAEDGFSVYYTAQRLYYPLQEGADAAVD